MSPSAGWFKNTEGAYSKGLNLLCPVDQSYSEIFHNCWTNVFFIPQRTDSVVWYFRKYYYTLLIKCSSSSSFGQLKITQNKTKHFLSQDLNFRLIGELIVVLFYLVKMNRWCFCTFWHYIIIMIKRAANVSVKHKNCIYYIQLYTQWAKKSN